MKTPKTLAELSSKSCRELPAKTPSLTTPKIAPLLKLIPGWSVKESLLSKTFKFEDFHDTIGFVNAVAWVANQQNHHPDLKVGYSQCTVEYSTHSVGGLSENDFICAARIERLRK